MTRRPGHAIAVVLPLLPLLACIAHEAPSTRPALGPAATAPPAEPVAPGHAYGVVHFPVACTAAAQEQFDLGVSQLHSFFYPETVKTFTRVAQVDPGCAMAYWGLALAQLPNPLVPPFDPAALKRASDAVEKGLSLATDRRERDWLEGLAPLFRDAATVDQVVRTRRYAAAMDALAARYPGDDEAQIFLALALLQAADPHDRTYSSQFRAAKILERLGPTHPRHPGIAHYEIHAYDHSPIASQGLAAADAYAAIAPAAPHAVHMPSHVYSMLGMWDRSIASNVATLEVARAYAAKNFPPGVTHAAAPHSLDFLEYAYLQKGMDREARAVVAEAAAIGTLNVTTLAQATGLAAIPVRHALERGDWNEAVALEPRPAPYPYAEAIVRFGRAVGAARVGTPEQQVRARAEIDRMKELGASYLGKPDQSFWADQTEILVQAASGWLARAQRDDAGALRLLRAAADLEDSIEKNVSMENRLFPAREQLAYLLLELGQPGAALTEFEASMKTTPNRLRGWSGAAQAAELAGHPGVARQYQERLRELTAEATGSRAEIDHARQGLASLPGP
jgi:tetratricopeptide (TPR) repeat protein